MSSAYVTKPGEFVYRHSETKHILRKTGLGRGLTYCGIDFDLKDWTHGSATDATRMTCRQCFENER